MNTHSLKRTTSENKDFINLVRLLDEDLAIRDGKEEHKFFAQFNKIDTIKHVVVCYEKEIAIACGAFKPLDEQTVEIKRMYVLPDNRGKGIGALVLNELECWADELNYNECVLETGKNNPEAQRLYQKAAYSFIDNYGQYVGVENSVCMAKKIKQPPLK